MDDKLRNFYLFLLVLGILLLLLTGLGYFWLGKLQEKMTEDEQAQLEAAQQRQKGRRRPHRPFALPHAGTLPEENRTHTVSESPTDAEPPHETRNISNSAARLEEIMQELRRKKTTEEPEGDWLRARMAEDCRRRLEKIGNLLLHKWVPTYGVGVYYPSADPEGALRTVTDANLENLLRCACNLKAGKRIVLVANLPRAALQVLPDHGILAYEPGPNYQGKRNVLFRAGYVRQLTEEQFQEAIKKQEAELGVKPSSH